MKGFALILTFLCLNTAAQTISQCRERYNNYLNFRSKLDASVGFTENSIYFKNSIGKKELVIYEDELPALSVFFENTNTTQQKKLIAFKGTSHLKKNQLDSLTLLSGNKKSITKSKNNLPLTGVKIALDPGHFATNLTEAASEQKYLYFAKTNADTVKLFESELTFATATILKKMLEEQGAIVMLTRSNANYCSFDCTFTYWVKTHKKRTLDSLKNNGSMPLAKYNKLIKANEYNLFWDFFRDYDLANRVTKINTFNPKVTAIIHYNVDEKNAPWKKTSPKNFTMTFIGGAFTADDIVKEENRADFIRLLISNQLNLSEQLSALTVTNFSKKLSIPIANANHAEYLSKNCNSTKSAGVFSRNLVLCRKINSPLVYGEALYQDCETECFELMKKDKDVYGIKTNYRIELCAKSYYEALLQFMNNN